MIAAARRSIPLLPVLPVLAHIALYLTAAPGCLLRPTLMGLPGLPALPGYLPSAEFRLAFNIYSLRP